MPQHRCGCTPNRDFYVIGLPLEKTHSNCEDGSLTLCALPEVHSNCGDGSLSLDGAAADTSNAMVASGRVPRDRRVRRLNKPANAHEANRPPGAGQFSIQRCSSRSRYGRPSRQSSRPTSQSRAPQPSDRISYRLGQNGTWPGPEASQPSSRPPCGNGMAVWDSPTPSKMAADIPE